MLQAELVAKIETPTTYENSDGKPKNAIGTGYPIQEGLVLTARHVLYHKNRDANLTRKIIWQKEDQSTPYLESKFTDNDIVFESEAFDVALVRCKTPMMNASKVVLYPDLQEPCNTWESLGYPTVGKDSTTAKRAKTPARGKIFKYDPDNHIQQLSTDADAQQLELWRGLSGAPVFNKDTGQLIAVITHIPDKYRDENGELRHKYKNVILATSIPYLLTKGKCSEFRALSFKQSSIDILLPPEKIGSAFSSYLVKKITRELRKSGVDGSVWCKQIAEWLEVDDIDSDADSLAVYKKIAYELENADVAIAIKALADATADCVTEEGLSTDEIQHKDKVKEAAQQILGWLVLGSIDDAQLHSVIPNCIKHDSLFFTLASVQSLTGVEVVMARRFNRITDFKHSASSEQKSNRIIEMPTSCLKWDADESVRKIFEEIWNQVFRDEHHEPEYQPSQHDWDRLNSELEVRRNNGMEHYYIPFKPSAHDVAQDFVMKVYEDLLIKLQQMTVIQYGEEGQECNLFLIHEAKLQAVINDFYRKINGE